MARVARLDVNGEVACADTCVRLARRWRHKDGLGDRALVEKRRPRRRPVLTRHAPVERGQGKQCDALRWGACAQSRAPGWRGRARANSVRSNLVRKKSGQRGAKRRCSSFESHDGCRPCAALAVGAWDERVAAKRDGMIMCASGVFMRSGVF